VSRRAQSDDFKIISVNEEIECETKSDDVEMSAIRQDNNINNNNNL